MDFCCYSQWLCWWQKLIGNDKPLFWSCTWGMCSCSWRPFTFPFFLFCSSAVSELPHMRPQAKLWNSDDPEACVNDTAIAKWHSWSILASALVVLAYTNLSLATQDCVILLMVLFWGHLGETIIKHRSRWGVKVTSLKYSDFFTLMS